jgi:RND family efflux transporter MFP subunit
VLLAGGCDERTSAPREVIRPVKTLLIMPGGQLQTRTFPGTVGAARQAELAFQVPGLIVSLPIKEGQRIAKGEVIAQLRQEDFQARLQTLQGQLDQSRAVLRGLLAGERPEERLRREAQVRAAEARLENARADHERNARLFRDGFIPQANFDQTLAAYNVAVEDLQSARQFLDKGMTAREEDIEAAKGQVYGLEGQVVEAQLRLQDATLLAPYDGVIARRFVEENQNVQAKQPVVQFQDVEEIEVVVDVPETIMAADLRTADIVEMSVSFSGAPGLQFPVQVREIAQVADPTTQTFQVRVALQAPETVRILPGMTATASMTYRRAAVLGTQVMLPASAIMQADDGRQIAWILGPEGTVQSRAVTLGAAVGSQIEVASGLEPGDRAVTAGIRFLREGMQVRDLGDALGAAVAGDVP